MNILPLEKRVAILSALVEGNSLRSTSRMTRTSINTVTKLLIDVGQACSDYQDKTMKNLTCKRLELDEIWAFCTRNKRTSPPLSKASSAMATCGPSLRLTPTRNSFPTGFTEIGRDAMLSPSSMTSRAV